MTTTGYSSTPLVRRLGIRPGDRVGTFGPPRTFSRLVGPLPPGAALVRSPRRDCDVSVSFGSRRRELASRRELACRVLPAAGGLWPAWRKKASGVATDLTFEVAQSIGLHEDLVDNKVCAVDHTWSAVRCVVPVAQRGCWE